jgi:hypothetical protein
VPVLTAVMGEGFFARCTGAGDTVNAASRADLAHYGSGRSTTHSPTAVGLRAPRSPMLFRLHTSGASPRPRGSQNPHRSLAID